MDICCAQCGEPWNVCGLRHDEEPGTYQKVLRGEGCPHCGYKHRKVGAFRERQLEELFDGVIDDDPMEYIW